MQRKAFQLQVELDLQAITCPGVWLCPVGKISLQLYMLESCVQTANAEPVFPVLCHEKFIFYKTFYGPQSLSELQRLLSKECLYIELIQWQTCELGTVLATFQTNLCELLYPSVREGAIPGIDIDLLMESSPSFPGTIAPKIEVCTKTVIEDTVCDGRKESAFVVNPKVIQSKRGSTSRSNCPHQRKVCHSAGYNRSQKRFPNLTKTGRPIFLYRKVDDDLLARKPQGLGPPQKENCKCLSSKTRNDVMLRMFTDTCKRNTNYSECPNPKNRPNFFSKVANCLCGHDGDNCPVCSKYSYYFEDASPRATKKSLTRRSCDKKSCICHRALQARGGNSKVIRCRCAQDNSKIIEYSKPKQSLAEKLHRRLTETLDICAESLDDCQNQNDNCTNSERLSPISERNGSEYAECECRPETNIGDFYRNFYKQARSKIHRDQHVTPCCI